ncbi:hypothetical protein J1605_018204 [Eschrichtius robustus]|uniref:Uncharacterized protein n=1 Tax=Eschrichtius robustus TaxID=9764 RepID=A0AB34HYR5_ESCRO|nr:hypothetical protein J1605_018204 [Eschrichtius robustus]
MPSAPRALGSARAGVGAAGCRRINLLLSPRPKSQQRRPGASLPLLRLQRPRCRGRSRCVIPSSETRTHKRRNARGQGAAPQGQEENICGFEGVLGPSWSAPPSRDPLPPPFSSWSVYMSSPRRLLQKRAGKGMLIPQLRSTGLALFRNFARGPDATDSREPAPLAERPCAGCRVSASPPRPPPHPPALSRVALRGVLEPQPHSSHGRAPSPPGLRPRPPDGARAPRDICCPQAARPDVVLIAKAVLSPSKAQAFFSRMGREAQSRRARRRCYTHYARGRGPAGKLQDLWRRPRRQRGEGAGRLSAVKQSLAPGRVGQKGRPWLSAKGFQHPGRAAQPRRPRLGASFTRNPALINRALNRPCPGAPSAQALPTGFHTSYPH